MGERGGVVGTVVAVMCVCLCMFYFSGFSGFYWVFEQDISLSACMDGVCLSWLE